eukprot:3472817-Rhodomonas_salina.1
MLRARALAAAPPMPWFRRTSIPTRLVLGVRSPLSALYHDVVLPPYSRTDISTGLVPGFRYRYLHGISTGFQVEISLRD